MSNKKSGGSTNAATPGREEIPITDPNFQEYPKMLYYKGNVNYQKTITSREDEEVAGEDWYDRPLENVVDVPPG